MLSALVNCACMSNQLSCHQVSAMCIVYAYDGLMSLYKHIGTKMCRCIFRSLTCISEMIIVLIVAAALVISATIISVGIVFLKR